MGDQIPVIPENPLATCGYRKFQLDPLGDHLNTCTVHSGAKKTHDWMVDQMSDLFLTPHKVKTEQVIKSRGQHCRDIELVGYLANETDPMPLVLHLRIAHDRFGSSSDPSLNGNLHYPNNIDRSLNETVDDKTRKYRSTLTLLTLYHLCLLFLVHLGGYTVNLSDFCFYRIIGKLTTVAVSGVQLPQSDRVQFHFRRAGFTQQFNSSKAGLV
jgi:hypothetical protein